MHCASCFSQAKRRLELEAAAPQDLQDGDWTPKKEMASRSHTAATGRLRSLAFHELTSSYVWFHL